MTPGLRALAAGARERGYDFILIGDEASPATFHLEGCSFFSLADQRKLDLSYAHACPTSHYARKNIGYLIAVSRGATLVVETDDDSTVYDDFWAERDESHDVATIQAEGWVNIYDYFGGDRIWPRGLPLDAIGSTPTPRSSLDRHTVACPIQQGLVDDDPDVDAIYRLLFPLPYRFEPADSIALGRGAWCPFNSQNTTWWPRAFPLLYLPAHCSFRMTDIWRSLVAQRIGWENDWTVLFHAATLRQERNVHDLMTDFAQEVPGYLNNREMADALVSLRLRPGELELPPNMRIVYECFVERGWLPEAELALLEAWLSDIQSLS